mgnify:CR=1 FL=1
MIQLQQTKKNIALSEKQYLKGDDGGYYVPTVDAEGNLSWAPTVEDMPIPDMTNIKGPIGDTGKPGEPGYTPVKGIDYFDGKDGEQGPPGPQGEPGKDGSPGRDGIDGAPGKDGKDGESGVYVGSNEPGAGVLVWIDTSGEGDTLEAAEGGSY